MRANTARRAASVTSLPAAVAPPAAPPEHLARRRWYAASSQERLNDVLAGLYREYRRPVLSSLLRLGVLPADAEDLCADVFMVALRKLPDYRGASSISTWLFGIARKLAADHRRSARVRTTVAADCLPELAAEDCPHQALVRRETARKVRRAVDALPAGPRGVVRGFAFGEAPMAEVARGQRVPLQTAYARLYSAHASLRLTLAPELDAAAS